MNNKVVKNVNGQVGDGVGFERIRRITGYLVGTLDRFNNGKRAEVSTVSTNCLCNYVTKQVRRFLTCFL